MAGLGRRTHYRKHLTDSVLNDFPEPQPPHSRLAKILGTRGSNQFDVRLATSNRSNNSNNTNDRQEELAILPTKFRKLVWLKRNDFVIVETADNVDEQHHHQEEEEEKATKTEASDSAAKAPNNNNGSNNTTTNNDTAGIRCMIAHILYHEQIKHLIAKGLWPDDDPEFAVEDRKLQEASHQPQADRDGIVFEEQYMPRSIHSDEEEYYDEGEEVGFNDDDGNDDDDNNPIQPTDDPMLFVNTNRLARLTVQDSSSDEEEDDDDDDD